MEDEGGWGWDGGFCVDELYLLAEENQLNWPQAKAEMHLRHSQKQ